MQRTLAFTAATLKDKKTIGGRSQEKLRLGIEVLAGCGGVQRAAVSGDTESGKELSRVRYGSSIPATSCSEIDADVAAAAAAAAADVAAAATAAAACDAATASNVAAAAAAIEAACLLRHSKDIAKACSHWSGVGFGAISSQ